MKVLVAEDEAVQRRIVEAILQRSGFEPVPVADGAAALEALTSPEGPRLAVLDWDMPLVTGPEVCQSVRQQTGQGYHYLVLLTARTGPVSTVDGLGLGADDFLSKPFDPAELVARLRVGERILKLEETLARRIAELERAQQQIAELEGFLPICMHCKSVRVQKDAWERIESYIARNSGARITHGICELCLQKHYPE